MMSTIITQSEITKFENQINAAVILLAPFYRDQSLDKILYTNLNTLLHCRQYGNWSKL